MTKMAPKISQHQLLQELQNDNMFFDELVDMIPAKLYVAQANEDSFNPKYFKGQAKESKCARKAKSKQAKRAKLDPALAETTMQTKMRLEGNRPLIPPAQEKPAAAAADTDKKSSDDTPDAPPAGNMSRIEALRAKLHAKLEEKRAGRPTDPNVVSKRAARKAEKKKRREEAAKRKKKTESKAEDKNAAKKYKVSTDVKEADAAADLAQMDFGRLHGLNSLSNDNYYKTNKSLAKLSKTKNLQKMLSDAQAKREKVEALKKGNEEEKQRAANIQWGDAIKEASGTRVKDDPTKIKKAIKRQATKKAKSAKAWKSRMDQTQQKMDDRQNIRNHNLKKRKVGGAAGANLSKKRIATEDDKTKGTRRPRAGFEGRKQEFLNDKKKAQ